MMDKEKKKMFDRYKKLYTGCVSDILKAMGYRSQVIDPAYRPISPGFKVCGTAVTVRVLPRRDSSDKDVKNELLEGIKPGNVVVLEEPSGMGGNMGTALKVRGAEGLIANGVRDIFEHKERGLAIYVKSISPGGAKYSPYAPHFMAELNVTIGLTGVQIRPGDIIFADDDGIVVVPKEIAEQVIDYAERYEELDMMVAEELLKGKTVIEAYKSKEDWQTRIGLKK